MNNSSSLVSYIKYSPNCSVGRTHNIDTFTPHCVVGQCSVETLGNIFINTARKASSNYGIGPDGSIGMYVSESNRSWCSSSATNDNRAITVEVASDTTSPYAFTDKAYKALIELAVDCCKRHDKTKMVWLGDDKNNANYEPKADEMRITLHKWYANKECPGQWLIDRLPEFVEEVNKRLGATNIIKTIAEIAPKPTTSSAKEKTDSIKGTYKIKAKSGLHLRKGPNSNTESITVIKYNEKVKCYGYHTGKWYYVQYGDKTGFCYSNYLTKE